MRFFAHHESSFVFSADDSLSVEDFDPLTVEVDNDLFKALIASGYKDGDHVCAADMVVPEPCEICRCYSCTCEESDAELFEIPGEFIFGLDDI